jgi:hypothetical protein
MRKHPDEIVYVEVEPGKMSPDPRSQRLTEIGDAAYRRATARGKTADRIAPWVLPALAVVLTVNYLVGEWLR